MMDSEKAASQAGNMASDQRAADEPEYTAGEREHMADQREHTADERQADERERKLGEREREAGLEAETLDQHTLEAIDRARY